MHQKRTKKMFLLTIWRMALFTKRAFFLFLSWHHLSRKGRHLYFLPCQMHQKRTKKCSFWLHEEWLSPQKEQFVCCCTFCLAKCIRKGQKNCSFWHEEWLSPQKEHIFCSFLNVISLEKNVTCTFCLAKCIRKGQKNCSFWLHEEWLSSQKEHFFLFLS